MVDHGQPLQSGSTQRDAILRAYNAKNLGSPELYSSSTDSENVPGYGIEFTAPVVANGKVYISNRARSRQHADPQGELNKRAEVGIGQQASIRMNGNQTNQERYKLMTDTQDEYAPKAVPAQQEKAASIAVVLPSEEFKGNIAVRLSAAEGCKGALRPEHSQPGLRAPEILHFAMCLGSDHVSRSGTPEMQPRFAAAQSWRRKGENKEFCIR